MEQESSPVGVECHDWHWVTKSRKEGRESEQLPVRDRNRWTVDW